MIATTILSNLDLKAETIAIKKFNKYPEVKVGTLLEALLEFNTMPEVASSLGRNIKTVSSKTIEYFGKLKPASSSYSWKYYLLNFINLKQCNNCEEIIPIDDFYINTKNKVDYLCKVCSNSRSKEYRDLNKDKYKLYYIKNRHKFIAKTAKYKARKLRACGSWSNFENIDFIYENCPEGYHVDHWAPLCGDNVCGLHTEFNLQYLSQLDNLVKSNKFDKQVCTEPHLLW